MLYNIKTSFHIRFFRVEKKAVFFVLTLLLVVVRGVRSKRALILMDDSRRRLV